MFNFAAKQQSNGSKRDIVKTLIGFRNLAREVKTWRVIGYELGTLQNDDGREDGNEKMNFFHVAVGRHCTRLHKNYLTIFTGQLRLPA